jgi:hypothetical protein
MVIVCVLNRSKCFCSAALWGPACTCVASYVSPQLFDVSRTARCRYVIIGTYVGVVTAAGFVWWFLVYEGGPQMSWHDLRHSQACSDADPAAAAARGYMCEVFENRRPSTVAMSVLVVVEMFNALNAISENGSLLTQPPWRNWWLVGAIVISMLLHCAILCALLLRIQRLYLQQASLYRFAA